MDPAIIAALSKPSSTPGGQVQPFTSSCIHDDGSNQFKLVCPREGCGSLILLKGVAKHVEGASVQIDLDGDTPPPSILPPLPAPPESMEWWLITPNEMQFENIGFSKGMPKAEGKQMKLLSCAECDLGPLGWSEVGSGEFWLACHRVSYRE